MLMCSQFLRTKLFKYVIHNPILPQIIPFTFPTSGCLLSCPLGYEPNTTCGGCNPVHSCVTNNPCQNGGTCNIGSTSTSYTCSCLPNYSGQTCEGKYLSITHSSSELLLTTCRVHSLMSSWVRTELCLW